jgi:NAD(P)-dependent dehydrogenase (short-subunit alcohol dehydrogenase family)
VDFAGKIALIPGATGALGSALAMALGKAGATVVLAGRNVKALEKRYDALIAAGAPEPAIYPINFEGAAQLDYESMADRLVETFGGVDVLAWSVGHWHGMEPLNNLAPPVWLSALHLNCTAPWLLFRALFDSLRARSGAAVFPLAPRALTELAFAGAYGAAQASLRNWVTSAASENERLMPRVYGVELPALKSKLRLAAFPAEAIDQVTDANLLSERYLQILQGAPGVWRLVE